jgi:hypothetical protein
VVRTVVCFSDGSSGSCGHVAVRPVRTVRCIMSCSVVYGRFGGRDGLGRRPRLRRIAFKASSRRVEKTSRVSRLLPCGPSRSSFLAHSRALEVSLLSATTYTPFRRPRRKSFPFNHLQGILSDSRFLETDAPIKSTMSCEDALVKSTISHEPAPIRPSSTFVSGVSPYG